LTQQPEEPGGVPVGGGPAGVPVGGLAAPSGGLTRSVTVGAGWLAGSRIASQIVQFGAGIVLARLLTPSDFGLLASIYVITGFSVLFFDLGLGGALVQNQHPTAEDENTVFWVNALGGLVFVTLISAAGPLIADVFNAPRLIRLAPLAALPFTLSIGVVQIATLQRRLQMRVLAVLELVTSSVGIAAGVTAAVLGAGVYSLTVAPIVQSTLMSAWLWTHFRWRPTGFLDRAAARRLWRFSGGQLGFNVVNYWSRNADNFLVGRYLGAAALGFYNRGYNLMLLPVQQVSQVLGRVMMPALAAVKDDHPRAGRAYSRAVALVDALAVPLLVGLAATAPSLVPFLWGSRWVPTVPLLQVLCIAGLPQCALASVGWLFQSQNRTGLMFRVGSASSAVGVLLMIAGLHWGVRGVAVAVLATSWVSLVPELFFACRLIDLPLRRVLRTIVGVGVAGAILFAAVWWTPTVLGLDRTRGGALAVQVLVGAVVYVPALRLTEPAVFADVSRLGRRLAGRLRLRRSARA